MKISSINKSIPFKTSYLQNIQPPQQHTPKQKKREFIDIIADSVRNPRDINDCVAVPRGIFKAYILLMAGSSMMMISSALPKKMTNFKMILNIASAVLSGLSAVFFAKPFAVKDLSPTVKKFTA